MLMGRFGLHIGPVSVKRVHATTRAGGAVPVAACSILSGAGLKHQDLRSLLVQVPLVMGSRAGRGSPRLPGCPWPDRAQEVSPTRSPVLVVEVLVD